MLRSLTLLAVAALGAAASKGRNGLKGAQANLLLPGANSNLLSISLACSTFETECDGFCIPSGSVCCGDGDGAYCDDGYTCYSEGCCEDGETCSGPPTGCTGGRELCGGYCIPAGSVCCEDSATYCDAGQTCTSTGDCELGSSNSDDDSTGSGCTSSQDECDGYCIPSGSVCCGDGYYCDAGETCTSGLQCDSSGSSDSSGSDTTSLSEDTSQPSETAEDSTSSTTTGLTIPSLDLGTDTSEDSGDDTVSLCARRKGGGVDVNVDGDGDDGCGAAGSIGIPVMFASFVAVLAFAFA